MITFSIYNYPKQFASLIKDSYRLKDYMHLSADELVDTAIALEKFVVQHAHTTPAISEYKNLPYIGSGWEWSTFRLDHEHVIKIPSGRFEEVNTREYAENTEYAYGVLAHYYGDSYVLETEFLRDGKLHLMQQVYVDGLLDYYVPFGLTNKIFLQHLKRFCSSTQKLLHEMEWMPDIEIKKEERGFLLKNVMCETETYKPKLIDFTHYLDPFRLYPARKDEMVAEYTKRLIDFSSWIEQQLAVSE